MASREITAMIFQLTCLLLAGPAEDDVLYFSNYPTDDRYDHRTISARQVTYD